MKTIVAATDLSQRSNTALERAGQLARAAGAELVVVHAVDDNLPERILERSMAASAEALAEQVAALGLAGARHEVAAGDIFWAIHRAATLAHADLVVVGDHRRSALRDMLRDTTAERLIRVSALPVLIARLPGGRPYGHALAGVESEEGAELLGALAQLGGGAPAKATLLHAVDSSATGLMYYAGLEYEAMEEFRSGLAQKARERLESMARGAPFETRVAIADDAPAAALDRFATQEKCDLVVVSSHARRIVARSILGSVSSHLIRRGATDVMIVPRVVRRQP